MSAPTYLFRSSAGIDHWMVQDGNQTRFASSQDVAPALELNKAMARHNDGYTADRTMRRAASIPYAVGLKWLNEEGWWFMDADKDPGVALKLVQKLNSNEYEFLRTAGGRLGVSDGAIR
jgi:hypothetical protein